MLAAKRPSLSSWPADELVQLMVIRHGIAAIAVAAMPLIPQLKGAGFVKGVVLLIEATVFRPVILGVRESIGSCPIHQGQPDAIRGHHLAERSPRPGFVVGVEKHKAFVP